MADPGAQPNDGGLATDPLSTASVGWRSLRSSASMPGTGSCRVAGSAWTSSSFSRVPDHVDARPGAAPHRKDRVAELLRASCPPPPAGTRCGAADGGHRGVDFRPFETRRDDVRGDVEPPLRVELDGGRARGQRPDHRSAHPHLVPVDRGAVLPGLAVFHGRAPACRRPPRGAVCHGGCGWRCCRAPDDGDNSRSRLAGHGYARRCAAHRVCARAGVVSRIGSSGARRTRRGRSPGHSSACACLYDTEVVGWHQVADGGYTLIAIAAAAVVMGALSGGGRCRGVRSSTSAVSRYGLYLSHYPVDACSRTGWGAECCAWRSLLSSPSPSPACRTGISKSRFFDSIAGLCGESWRSPRCEHGDEAGGPWPARRYGASTALQPSVRSRIAAAG